MRPSHSYAHRAVPGRYVFNGAELRCCLSLTHSPTPPFCLPLSVCRPVSLGSDAEMQDGFIRQWKEDMGCIPGWVHAVVVVVGSTYIRYDAQPQQTTTIITFDPTERYHRKEALLKVLLFFARPCPPSTAERRSLAQQLHSSSLLALTSATFPSWGLFLLISCFFSLLTSWWMSPCPHPHSSG